jgi:RNA polymerase sigma factor (TIGR02999 family)
MDITTLLDAARSGDPHAAERLLRLVYDELNHLAAAQMAHEQPDRTLTSTALVHEAYLRLLSPNGTLPFENRRHFFAAAAQSMRRILIDAARHRARDKRGAGVRPIQLPDLPADQPDSQLLALDEALTRLAAHDPALAEIVNLHHFAGLSHEQIAEILALTVYEVRSRWTFARAWLRDALS